MEQPTANLVIRQQGGKVFVEAKFRYEGRQVMRRIGPAWFESDGAGGWKQRRRRPQTGYFTEPQAHARAAELVAEYVSEADAATTVRREAEIAAAALTFRQVAHDYLVWLEKDYRAKPSTIRDYGYVLAEPGTPRKRGAKPAPGHIMGALGNSAADRITKADVQKLLRVIGDTGVSPRSVNKARNIVGAIFSYGMNEATDYKLTDNPVVGIKARREPDAVALDFYSPEEVEAAARALASDQDAEAVRISAYCGLRQGELLALRWGDVHLDTLSLTVSRALSAKELATTKSGKVRQVPLSDQVVAALDRLSRRVDYTGSDDLVICSADGRPLDGSALRKRFQKAATSVGLRPLKWHDLRHTFGSLLVGAGIDLVTVKAAMGHSRITTTERYLHARPATQTAAAFTAAFTAASPAVRAC